MFIKILEDKKMSLFQTFIQKVGIVVLVLAISGSVLAADFKSIQASAESGDVNAQLELAEKYETLEKLDSKVVNFEPQELYYEGKAVDENAKKSLS